MNPVATRPWWANAVVYQVYLRSFQDGDGDGLGDLGGVEARLDHLCWLGVDALWLSPFHPSPLLDGGYDISDFTAVDPRFGDLEGFDRLLAEAHRRDLKVIMDLVPNHTSDRHPWFQESRSSRDSTKRDWYVWRDGRNGGPPSNWDSMLSGPAWTRDPATGQFYYHAFLPEQPDLNWRNPAVRDAMLDVMRFWLARGVDGFRVDAVPHLVEDDLLRDDLPGTVNLDVMPVQTGLRHVYTSDRPETLDCVAAMRSVADAFDDRVLIGEIHLPIPLVTRYRGGGERPPGVHMPFNFALLETPWTAAAIEAAIDKYLGLLPPDGCPNWLIGNHDEVRVASRLGPGPARSAALLSLTLGGPAFIYNGEELGLTDVPVDARDLASVPEHRHPAHAAKYMPHRSPMPWDGGRHAGFTSGSPWLPLGRENEERNVAAQRADEGSLLWLYRRLIALRRFSAGLRSGAYEPARRQGEVLVFGRIAPEEALQVAVNVSDAEQPFRPAAAGRVVLSTSPARGADETGSEFLLRPHEGLILRSDRP